MGCQWRQWIIQICHTEDIRKHVSLVLRVVLMTVNFLYHVITTTIMYNISTKAISGISSHNVKYPNQRSIPYSLAPPSFLSFAPPSPTFPKKTQSNQASWSSKSYVTKTIRKWLALRRIMLRKTWRMGKHA